MTIDFTKPVCTRDGRRVKIISTSHRSTEDTTQYSYPIRAEVEHPSEPGKNVKWSYMICGRWKSNDPCNRNDLIQEMPWHRWLRDVRDDKQTTGSKRVGH